MRLNTWKNEIRAETASNVAIDRKMLSETELLENYIRRDNIKIFGRFGIQANIEHCIRKRLKLRKYQLLHIKRYLQNHYVLPSDKLFNSTSLLTNKKSKLSHKMSRSTAAILSTGKTLIKFHNAYFCIIVPNSMAC